MNIFESKLKEKYPFATKFFEAALNTNKNLRKLAHAFLLTGNDATAQYMLALNIAKILNCKSDNQAEFCDCTSCSWLSQNRHPAVITVSPLDYTVEKKTQKNIAVENIRHLRKELANTSQYHRVIIFTDAKEGIEYQRQVNQNCRDFELPCPKYDIDDEERIWVPQPLDYNVLRDDAANTLLKIVEEPGEDITFFFLTKDKEDMINTIVSRCQTVPVNSREIPYKSIEFLGDVLESFPPKDELQAILTVEHLFEIAKNEDYKVQELLEFIQEYFRRLINSNLENKKLVSKLTEAIKKAEAAKLEIDSYVNPHSALETFLISCINLY